MNDILSKGIYFNSRYTGQMKIWWQRSGNVAHSFNLLESNVDQISRKYCEAVAIVTMTTMLTLIEYNSI